MGEFYNPKDTALIIIDMQNDFCHEEGAIAKRNGTTGDFQAFQAVVPKIKAVIDQARLVDVPIIFVKMTLDDNTRSEAWNNKWGDMEIIEKGSWGAEFYKLEPQEGDYIVEKHRYSAFVNTNLDLILRSTKRKSLVITGVVTNVCVESTVRDGFMLDYNVTVISDGCAGTTPEMHEAALAHMEFGFASVRSSAGIVNYWGSETAVTN